MTTKKTIIGISGGSGSGKTSFVAELKNRFDKKDVCVISMDEYYMPRESQVEDNEGVKNFDLPTSIDEVSFHKDLTKLIHGESVEKEEYVFNNKSKTPRLLRFDPAPIIIVEGLFIFHYKTIAPLLEYKVFIDVSDVLKVIRRIKRDGLERNYPLDDVLYRYAYHVKPSYEKFIEPYKGEVDVVINNNDSYQKGLNIISGFIESQLK